MGKGREEMIVGKRMNSFCFPYYFKARISEEMDETVTQLTMSVFVGRTQNNSIITLPL